MSPATVLKFCRDFLTDEQRSHVDRYVLAGWVFQSLFHDGSIEMIRNVGELVYIERDGTIKQYLPYKSVLR